jgi:hypothetical protein
VETDITDDLQDAHAGTIRLRVELVHEQGDDGSRSVTLLNERLGRETPEVSLHALKRDEAVRVHLDRLYAGVSDRWATLANPAHDGGAVARDGQPDSAPATAAVDAASQAAIVAEAQTPAPVGSAPMDAGLPSTASAVVAPAVSSDPAGAVGIATPTAPANPDGASGADVRGVAAPTPQAVPVVPVAQRVPTSPPKPAPVLPALGLPNGTVGADYDASLNAADLSEFEIVGFEGLEAFGLAYDAERMAISGKPTSAGDQKFTVQYRPKVDGDTVASRPVLSRELTLVIIADPRSLWKDIPSNPSEPYAKPDSARELIRAERWMAAASQRGRSHAQDGRFRDDAFLLKYFKDTDWYFAAVSDGAGSAKFSRKGSEIACATALAEVTSVLEGDGGDELTALAKALGRDTTDGTRSKLRDHLYHTMGTAAFKAYKAIQEEATVAGAEMRDYAATLMFVICKKINMGVFGGSKWFVASYWVGDGGAAIYRRGEAITTLGEPDGGDYAGQTYFLTMRDMMDGEAIQSRIRFELVPDFTAIVLMSDGVSDPKFETDANHANTKCWDEFWTEVDGVAHFGDRAPDVDVRLLGYMDFWSKGNHDDRTLAVIF